ncbi:Ras guanine nucleotide exchange factor F [Phytophthora cinnamomi]|uniref:Ras guanine nucleotide exchange factor F n=1 Tax=Phytophthora cinnamomi TaxID=4785 RepID=UPI0035596E59|nr:Ras guanine nucleotide exchange factor F [Phytophthora cinnamomi]
MRRSAHAIATFEDNMYLFGGIGTNALDEDIEYNDTWVFDLVDRQWSELQVGNSRPSNRFHHAGVLHANTTVNEFIIFGGLSLLAAETDQASATTSNSVPVVQYNDVWRLSLTETTPEWVMDPTPAKAAEVPDARSEPGIVIYDDYLFMFGGIAYDENGVDAPVDYNDLWRYDLATYTWKNIEPAGDLQPPTRFSHSVALLHDDDGSGEAYLLAYSGRHLLLSSWTLLDDIWVYNFNNNEWSSVTPSSDVPRAYTSIVTTNGVNMWFFGGYYKPQQSSSGYVYDDIVLGKFDLQNMVMQARHAVIGNDEASPPLRYNHRAALWRGDSMVIHGGSYQSQLGDVWVYNTTNAETTEVTNNTLPLDPESLVYVLGAFIVTVVFVLLVLLLRWRRADRRNVRAAQMRGAAVVRGVTKERLDQLRITKYCRAERNPESPTEQLNPAEGGSTENDDVCPICLIEFEDGEDVRNLPCKHIFHVACIDEWLKRNTSCPMCKSNVDLDAVDITVENTSVGRGGAVVTPVP